MAEPSATAPQISSPGSSSVRAAADLDIVIVNWNSGALLAQCVDALARANAVDNARCDVIIVDNGSIDGSLDTVPCGPTANIIRNAQNRGFAAACNQGARHGHAPAILFLNPDTRVMAGALRSALNFLFAPGNEAVGIVGIRLCDELGAAQRCTARKPTPCRLIAQSAGLDRLFPRIFPPHFLLEHDHDQSRMVDQVMGAFLLIHRPLFETLGGFDERFFLYYEDVDLCLGARASGWEVAHFAGASAVHQGGGTTERIRARRLFLHIKSRIQFVAKHHSRVATVAVTAAALLLELPGRFAVSCARGSWPQARDAAVAAGHLVRELLSPFGWARH